MEYQLEKGKEKEEKYRQTIQQSGYHLPRLVSMHKAQPIHPSIHPYTHARIERGEKHGTPERGAGSPQHRRSGLKTVFGYAYTTVSCCVSSIGHVHIYTYSTTLACFYFGRWSVGGGGRAGE